MSEHFGGGKLKRRAVTDGLDEIGAIISTHRSNNQQCVLLSGRTYFITAPKHSCDRQRPKMRREHANFAVILACILNNFIYFDEFCATLRYTHG